MSPPPEDQRYTFGDSTEAATRLQLLAHLFAPTSRALLATLARRRPDRVVDLGCGPGHTTEMLAELFPSADVVGVERSPAFVAQATDRAPARCRFVEGDVTERPLPGAPADLVYARYLLSHLASPRAVLSRWTDALAPGGVLVVEEPEDIVTDDEVFQQYLGVVRDLMGSEGGELYCGRLIHGAKGDPAGIRRAADEVVDLELPADRVAELFWLNSRAWSTQPHITSAHDPAVIGGLRAELDRRRTTPTDDTARWRIRQVVLEAVL